MLLAGNCIFSSQNGLNFELLTLPQVILITKKKGQNCISLGSLIPYSIYTILRKKQSSVGTYLTNNSPIEERIFIYSSE